MSIVGEPILRCDPEAAAAQRLRAGVAHDLRNPLTALVQLAESLSAREVLTPDGRAELAGLLQAAKGSLRRIESLSDRLSEDAGSPMPEPTLLREVITDAARATGFSPSMVKWIPRTGDPRAEVDPDQLRRAVEHVLANVRRHANGSGSVFVRCTPEGFVVEVADRGPGFSAASVASGLRYAQQATENVGGNVQITPRSDGGTIVRLEWPVAVELREDPSVPESDPEDPMNVWVADDEPLVRKALGRLLRASGYSVRLFETGDALLEALPEVAEVPEVIICDGDMPGTHGLDVLARVRMMAPSAARVMYTAYQPTGRVVEAFNTGAVQRFIRKGQDAHEIEACLATLAEERKVLGTTAQRRDNAMRVAFEQLLADRLCTLFLQPIYDAGDRHIVAAEALLRSRHDAFRGPLDIIDAARAFGREHALQAVLSEIVAEHRQTIPAEVDVFMNVDPAVLKSPERLDEAFAPVYPHAAGIVVEITERAQLGDTGAWEKSVQVLREKGFRLALDDVGAGYNSLGAVVAVNPDVIKLDISLVSGLHQDRAKADLVRLLSEFANRQNVATVGEGIEEPEEAARCTELGVRLLQGYHLARPMPIEDLMARHFEERRSA